MWVYDLAVARLVLLFAAFAALAAPPVASAKRLVLTERQAQRAAKLALDDGIASLTTREVGSAPSKITRCRVRARRATCYGVSRGIVTCHVRLRVLLAGRLPASDPDARVLVWADRIDCG